MTCLGWALATAETMCVRMSGLALTFWKERLPFIVTTAGHTEARTKRLFLTGCWFLARGSHTPSLGADPTVAHMTCGCLYNRVFCSLFEVVLDL